MTYVLAAANDDDLFGNFFDSDTWAVARNLAVFFVVVLWLATAYWVYCVIHLLQFLFLPCNKINYRKHFQK